MIMNKNSFKIACWNFFSAHRDWRKSGDATSGKGWPATCTPSMPQPFKINYLNAMAEQMDDAQPLLRRCRAPPLTRALAAVAPTASEGSTDAYARHIKLHT